MTIKDQLEPHDRPRVMDLVEAAGLDVSGWAVSQDGPVEHPASNPAYCYEWAFVEGDKVVLNLWHDELTETDGRVFDDVSPRGWADLDGRPSTRKRATRFEEAIAHAFDGQLQIRVIIGDGTKRPPSESTEASLRMERRLLDDEPWFVERYDPSTSAARIVRGIGPRYVDQFSIPDAGTPPRRRETAGEAWVRDQRIRLAVRRRAQGKCELCGATGFLTASGDIYVETHHVTPLSENGEDNERNVVALCPNHHREAHHGGARDAIRERLRMSLARLSGSGT